MARREPAMQCLFIVIQRIMPVMRQVGHQPRVVRDVALGQVSGKIIVPGHHVLLLVVVINYVA